MKALDPAAALADDEGLIRTLADATPMPYSGNGMAILQRYAPELATATLNSLTVGRQVPEAPLEDAASPPRRSVAPVARRTR